MCNPSPTLALYLISKPFAEKSSNSLSSTIVVPDLSQSLTNKVLYGSFIVFHSTPPTYLMNESSNQITSVH